MRSTSPDPSSVDATAPGPTASDPTAIAAAELTELVLGTEVIVAFLTELAHRAAAALPGALSCGITVRRDNGPMTIASSDIRAADVDEIQYRHHDGPCLHSLESGHMVVVTDLTRDDRWNSYRTAALGLGIRSSLSLTLNGDGQVRGALNLYSTRPHTFGTQEQLVASWLADEAGRGLTLAVRIADRTEMSDQLQQALATRTVIDQAIGIIMGQNRCDAAEAFAVLRILSKDNTTTLHTVAAEIVARSADTGPKRPGPSHGQDNGRAARPPSHSPTPTRSPTALHDPQRLAAAVENARRTYAQAHRARSDTQRMRAANEALRARIQQPRTNAPSTYPSASATEQPPTA
jgi:hypothetical protein